jgi:hypothetical protein
MLSLTVTINAAAPGKAAATSVVAILGKKVTVKKSINLGLLYFRQLLRITYFGIILYLFFCFEKLLSGAKIYIS